MARNGYGRNGGGGSVERGGRSASIGYMQREEEWEREGLLDPAWEKQQKKVWYTAAIFYVFIAKNCKYSNGFRLLLTIFMACMIHSIKFIVIR